MTFKNVYAGIEKLKGTAYSVFCKQLAEIDHTHKSQRNKQIPR